MTGVEAPADLVVTGAELVATFDAEDRQVERGWVAVSGGQFSAVGGPGDPVPRATTTLDASGCLVTPGLVNTHHHLYQNFTPLLPARSQRLAVHLAHHDVPAVGGSRRNSACRFIRRGAR